jgi:hypothetical protein
VVPLARQVRSACRVPAGRLVQLLLQQPGSGSPAIKARGVG